MKLLQENLAHKKKKKASIVSNNEKGRLFLWSIVKVTITSSAMQLNTR